MQLKMKKIIHRWFLLYLPRLLDELCCFQHDLLTKYGTIEFAATAFVNFKQILIIVDVCSARRFCNLLTVFCVKLKPLERTSGTFEHDWLNYFYFDNVLTPLRGGGSSAFLARELARLIARTRARRRRRGWLPKLNLGFFFLGCCQSGGVISCH